MPVRFAPECFHGHSFSTSTATVQHLHHRLTRHHIAAPKRTHAEHAFIAHCGDFDRCAVLHHGRDGTHPTIRKEDVANRVAAFQQDLFGSQRNGFQMGQNAAEVFIGKRSQQAILGSSVSRRRSDGRSNGRNAFPGHWLTLLDGSNVVAAAAQRLALESLWLSRFPR